MQATLDITKSQEVSYCIDLWLRDEQIRLNLEQCRDRFEAFDGFRSESVAVACYGPSLNETWEELRRYSHIITCSGAHRFLIDRGIVPAWHVDVDPRAHKIKLIGEPHKDVEYLLASTCHPSYVKMLVDGGFNVRLWHVFDPKEDAFRVLPHGEWAFFGGSDAGHRAMVIAAALGFRDIHVYGMDGCEGETGKHAAAHPSQPKGYSLTEFNGKQYRTTPAMLECVRQLPHEVEQLGDVSVIFHGEGLAQAYMADFRKSDAYKGQAGLGILKPELISAEYAALNQQLHKENLAYGVGGGKHAETVIKLAANPDIKSVLDYGAGKGYLAKALPFPIWEYDPAIPGKQESPRPADLVVCTDVLEHIEPDKLMFVLDDLKRVTLKVGYFVIHTGPAAKKLPDGRNTHLIQRKKSWWERRLKQFFHIGAIKQAGPLLYVVVGPHRERPRYSVSAMVARSKEPVCN